MRFVLASLLAACAVAADSSGCAWWKKDLNEKKYVCAIETWICTCDGHPTGTQSPCEGQSADVQAAMAAGASAGGAGFTSAGCLIEDLQVNGGTAGVVVAPTTPTTPAGSEGAEVDGAASLAGYGAIAVAALAAIAN